MSAPTGAASPDAARAHAPPALRAVLAAQLRVVGYALRAPALVAAAAAGVTTLVIAGSHLRAGERIDFEPQLSMLPGVAGILLAPWVWRGRERTGDGFLWMLPVDRRTHALARVFAGWAWLMAAVALFVAWLLALALATGGTVLGAQAALVLPSPEPPAPGTLDPSALRALRWTPSPLLWLAPFTGATGAYLVASALTLGVRRPLRWLGGVLLVAFLVSEFGLAAGRRPLALLPAHLLRTALEGPYGVDALLTGRTESLRTMVTLAGGRPTLVWRELPDLGAWARATLLWTCAGLLLVWLAASRHRERRRSS
jgi:hypothetical protein